MAGYVWLAVFWALFGIAHSAMAANWFKNWAKRISGRFFDYYRLFYALIFAIALLLIVAYHFRLPAARLWEPTSWMYIMSVLTALSGFTIMGVCARKYIFYLTGLDLFFPQMKPEKTLTTSGIHGAVRHPLYLGTLLVLWGLALSIPIQSYLISCGMITLYTLIGIISEEKKLREEFGEAYEKYRRQTPMLIPFTKFGKKRSDL